MLTYATKAISTEKCMRMSLSLSVYVFSDYKGLYIY